MTLPLTNLRSLANHAKTTRQMAGKDRTACIQQLSMGCCDLETLDFAGEGLLQVRRVRVHRAVAAGQYVDSAVVWLRLVAPDCVLKCRGNPHRCIGVYRIIDRDINSA